jgi:hypothetical protein
MLADLHSRDRVVNARPSHLEFEFLAGNHHVHEQSGYSGVWGDFWSAQPALGHRLVKFIEIRIRATKARLSSQPCWQWFQCLGPPASTEEPSNA